MSGHLVVDVVAIVTTKRAICVPRGKHTGATALLAGRLDDAADQASRAERLAEDLGDADAVWIGDIQRWELARFTGERATYRRRRSGGQRRRRRRGGGTIRRPRGAADGGNETRPRLRPPRLLSCRHHLRHDCAAPGTTLVVARALAPADGARCWLQRFIVPMMSL